jgi:hypothetical protein
MTTAVTTRPTRRRAEGIRILRWVFVRGNNVLTCEVRANGRQSHDVCVVPHWDVSSSVVERHARAASAFRRHAEIVSTFRQSGWILVRDARALHAAVSA